MLSSLVRVFANSSLYVFQMLWELHQGRDKATGKSDGPGQLLNIECLHSSHFLDCRSVAFLDMYWPANC